MFSNFELSYCLNCAETQSCNSSENFGIQCNLLAAPSCYESSLFSDGIPATQTTENDPTWLPSSQTGFDFQSSLSEPKQSTPLLKESKYIVFQSALMQLLCFCHCQFCGSFDITTTNNTTGTLLTLTISCSACLQFTIWNSQPFINDISAGNLLLSASILFAGATPTTFLRVFNHMNIASISERTFFRHEQFILLPAILRVWEKQ